MCKKFNRKFMQAATFEEWIERLKRFDYQLIKDNGLQMWTMQDFKNYWAQYKKA